MKKPSLEEVKEYFKDAETVKDPISNEVINLSDYHIYEKGRFKDTKNDIYINHKLKVYDRKCLYCSDAGYAKILTYKKPSFRPIAMKCNQEQFDAVKWKLRDYRTGYIDNFNEYPYLTNYLQHGNQISNSTEFYAKNNTEKHELHETWNEKVFLEACGIEIEEPKEETFVITKEQILEFHKHGTFETKQQAVSWFPSAFVEDKKELVLESGKWYKRPHNKALFCIVGNPENEPFEVYGFDIGGNWMEPNKITDKKVQTFKDNEVEATPEEVKEALTKEAVKRGYVGKHLYITNGKTQCELEEASGTFHLTFTSNLFFYQGATIFNNGVWAEIIPIITKSEAEQKLNCKII